VEAGLDDFLLRGRSYGMEHQFCSRVLDATSRLMRPVFSFSGLFAHQCEY
jgi:hypothetical protein